MPKAESAMDIGAQLDPLSPDEEDELQLTFERGFEDTRTRDTEVIVEKFREYMEEIRIAAQAAKHELNGSYDGQSPTSGNFGADLIHPGYFGWNSWDEVGSVTSPGEADWLDGSTPTNNSSGGSGGFADPLRIGDPVVHIILGYGSYASDPTINRIKEEKNDNPFAAVNTEEQFRNSDLRIKWLDTPRVLQPDDTFSARYFLAGENGSDYEDAPYPVGITFLEAQYYRILNPSNMAGSDASNIVTW